MSDTTIDIPENTVSNVAIDKDYLLGALKTFDGAILEKKYSFKVDGDTVNGIGVPEAIGVNNGITFQYIGDGTDGKELQYGYFYKVISVTDVALETYTVTDTEGTTLTAYLYDNHLWEDNNGTYRPINGAKFNLTESDSKLTYRGETYTKSEQSITGTLAGYLAINTQPDAAEPITYSITELPEDTTNPNIRYQLLKTELGVTSEVDGSIIEIPKARILDDTMLLVNVHAGDPNENEAEVAGSYYASNYEGGVEPLPNFTETDFNKGDDTYIMLVFDTSNYVDNDGSEIDDKSYVYIPTTSLLDETDLGYGLKVDDGGVFNVTTQVTALPGSDIVNESERQTYLATYAGKENNPKVVQLTTNGLFYELKSTIVEGVTTYEWKYIAPVIFNEQSIEFKVAEFQIGGDTESTYTYQPTTDAGAGDATDPSGD